MLITPPPRGFLWSDRLFLSAEAAENRTHLHSSVVVAISLHHRMAVCIEDGPEHEGEVAVIAPSVPFRLSSQGQPMLVLHADIDREFALGQALRSTEGRVRLLTRESLGSVQDALGRVGLDGLPCTEA